MSSAYLSSGSCSFFILFLNSAAFSNSSFSAADFISLESLATTSGVLFGKYQRDPLPPPRKFSGSRTRIWSPARRSWLFRCFLGTVLLFEVARVVLSKLMTLYIEGTGLCAPEETDFQAWLQGIETLPETVDVCVADVPEEEEDTPEEGGGVRGCFICTDGERGHERGVRLVSYSVWFFLRRFRRRGALEQEQRGLSWASVVWIACKSRKFHKTSSAQELRNITPLIW